MLGNILVHFERIPTNPLSSTNILVEEVISPKAIDIMPNTKTHVKILHLTLPYVGMNSSSNGTFPLVRARWRVRLGVCPDGMGRKRKVTGNPEANMSCRETMILKHTYDDKTSFALEKGYIFHQY